MPDPVVMQHFEIARKPDGSIWELGRGAMGVTYKAINTELGGAVALKVINAAYLHDNQARERFLREARAAAYLHHPNVASVFHLGREADSYFYAMEFVEGETLASVVERDGALPTRLALRIILQAAQGLSAASERGLIHRDVKPANLMLTRREGGGDADDDDLLVKVIDFGLAKTLATDGSPGVSLTGVNPVGTPYYMSPEQIEASVGVVDARSDIYSLGVTLWCMLTGKPPFQGSQFQVFSQHLHQPPPLTQLSALGLPAGVAALLEKMLAKNPTARQASHRELVAEVKTLLRTLPAGAEDPNATLAWASGNDAGSTTVGPTPAATHDHTAGFPLLDALRARGTLPAAEVCRLLEVLAPEVDASRGSEPVELRPGAVLIRFSPPPTNFDGLPALDIRQWPVFSCVLRGWTDGNVTLADPAETQNSQTLLATGQHAAGGQAITSLAMLVYELLAGHPPAGSAQDATVSPLPSIGADTNTVLQRALRTSAKEGVGFTSATEFAQKFTETALTKGVSAAVDPLGAGHGSNVSAAARDSANAVPPAMERTSARRAKSAGDRLAWIGLCLLIPTFAVCCWYFSHQNAALMAGKTTGSSDTARATEPTPGTVGVTSPTVNSSLAGSAQSTIPPASPAATVSPQEEEEREERLLAEQEARTKAARTLRVPKQYPTIQGAIDAAESGDTVSVSPGTYREALRMKEGLRLIGTERDTVVVTTTADLDALAIVDCRFGKVSQLTFEQTTLPPGKESQPAVLIKNSAVQFGDCRVRNAYGYGIYLRGTNRSTVENCEVINAGSDGIHVMDTGAAPTIRGNHVKGGRSNGILFHMHGTGVVTDNTSEQNSGSGITLLGADVNPQVQGNRFLNNRKWGVYIARPAAPEIASDNVVKGNDLGSTHDEEMPKADPMQGMSGM